MPRNARTDPHDHPCAVKGCENVAQKYGICSGHYRDVMPLSESIAWAGEHMTTLHRLRLKHTRRVRRLAREAGFVLVTKPSYYETDRA